MNLQLSGDQTKFVVLGANSFSGQDFVDLLLEDESNRVVGISRSPERSSTFLKYKIRTDLTRYKYYQLDLNTDMEELLKIIDEFEPYYVINFAAQSEVGPSWDFPGDWFQTNCVSLATLVQQLSKRDYLGKYLHVSSPEVYGNCEGTVKENAPLNPSTPYAASKGAADLLLSAYYRQLGFPLLTVRATNVYGARQQLYKIIPRSVIYIKQGRKIELHGGGRAVKSYINIRDVSLGELAVLKYGEIGSLYHLSPDIGIEVREVVSLICKILNVPFAKMTIDVEERIGQDAAYVIDSGRARSELDWAPSISIEEGLDSVVGWVNDYWESITKIPLVYEHKK